MTMRFIWSFVEKLLSVALLALIGAAAVFFAMRAAPGDPALAVLGDQATPDAIAAFRSHWHLDDPLIVQFWLWLKLAIQGDFGTSLTMTTGTPVQRLLALRIPPTIFIGTFAVILSISVSVVAGSVSVLQHGRLGDTIATSLAAVGISMPDFWIAYVLIFYFALHLGWFPAYGYVSPSVSIIAALYSGFLPAVAIAAPMAAVFTRILRTSLLENLYQEHVMVARSLGHSSGFIFAHHIMRNALIPYVTVIGLQIRYLLGGTVIIERIFGIPGIGNLMVDAAFARDFPVVQACALVFLLGVLVANLFVDIVCVALNPKGG
jgi:peptide/nickel transport system permease protein